VNNELERIWKEAVMVLFKLLEELSKTTVTSVKMAGLWAKV
jgi:hypothetical protein